MNTIYVVGIGPGKQEQMTLEARDILDRCQVIVGYGVYTDLLKAYYPDKKYVTTPMRREVERCRMAFEAAAKGAAVAMVCSGDAGVYGMAGLMLELEPEYPGCRVQAVPGLTAALAGGALLGAPLMHDFAVISLSDLLTPWEKIEKRLRLAAEADLAICLYNPASKKRHDYLTRACRILLEVLEADRICGVAVAIGREGEYSRMMTLSELADYPADMFTTVFIGNSATYAMDGRMVTPRGYQLREGADGADRVTAAGGALPSADGKAPEKGSDGQRLAVMCERVKLPDEQIRMRSRQRWDGIAKPLSGLGRLEEMISQIAAVQGREDVTLNRKAVVVFCGDNGIAAEGVTQTDSHVTAVVTENLARGITSINRMAAVAGAEVLPVDMGVAADLRELGIRHCKLGYGTANFCREPAMTRQQALEGILTGIRIAGELKDSGYDILATGEMGIGNTTTASAIASVLLQVSPAAVTGRGAGLSDAGFRKKIAAIEMGIALHKPDHRSPVDVLTAVGGFDIAGMCGLILGAAIYRIPVVLDGMISAAAALLAVRICPAAKAYLLASHLGKEPAGRLIMQALEFRPVIQAELSLGEGTGAVLLFPMLDMALEVYRENSTFDDIHIDAYERFEE